MTVHVLPEGYAATDGGNSLDVPSLGLHEPGISVEEAALRAYISCCQDRLLLHAAALVMKEQAIVLAAPTTQGKTTLTMGLLAQGWRFMSDEVVPLFPDTWWAAPFPRALHVRRHSLAVLEAQELLAEFHRVVCLLQEGRATILGLPRDPEPLPARRGVAAIVFPTYAPGAAALPTRLPTAVATSRLLQQTLNGGTLGPLAFRWAVEIARQVPCYSLPVDGLRPAAAALATLLS